MPRCDDVSAIADVPGADELAFRRSLRGSRARRAAAAVSRRRTLRSRGSALVAAAGMLFMGAGAIASTGGAPAGDVMSKDTIAAVQQALGLEADGVIGPATRRATKRFQRAHGLKPDGLLGPKTLKALGVDPANLEVASAALDPRLEAIAQCESAGDPTAVSATGQYRGKYQFDAETWASVGGTGDPAQASEAEQDRRASRLFKRKGTAPWPNCA
jgi:peptidoglycan hydrolase-like protein with peptidoglycan-binding domain